MSEAKIKKFLSLIIKKDKFLKENVELLLEFLKKFKKDFKNFEDNELNALGRKFLRIYEDYGKDINRVLSEFEKFLKGDINSEVYFYINKNIYRDIKKILSFLEKRRDKAVNKESFNKIFQEINRLCFKFLKEKSFLEKEKILKKIETLIVNLYLQTLSKEQKEKLKVYLLKYIEEYPWSPSVKEKTLKNFIKKFVLKELKFPYPRISLYGSLHNFHEEK